MTSPSLRGITSQVVIMAETHGHHSPHSGYGRIVHYLPGALAYGYAIERPALVHTVSAAGREVACLQVGGRDLVWAPADPVLRRVLGQRHWAPLKALAGEAGLRAMMAASPRRLYHLAYGDDQYGLLGTLGWPSRRRLVATFHQPPDVLWTYFRRQGNRLGRLDGALVFTEEQRRVFEPLLGPDRVLTVTQGVDATYWRPEPAGVAGATPMVLAVGSWLRDVQTLRAVAAGVAERWGGEVEMVVVTHPDRAGDLSGCGATVRSAVAEDELRRLYRSAAVTVLALLDGTVNNAMAESLACGTPVVASRVATSPWPSDGAAVRWVPPGDPAAVLEALAEVLADPDPGRRRAAARREAEAIDWPVVAAAHVDAYRRLLG